MEHRVGQQLGNYRLLRLLGQGGFSDVYLGEHLHLKTLAAIKVLQMRLLASMMEQFRTEAQAIASLVHPHIVRILDFGLTDGVPFLIMDYAPNGTLRDQYPKGTRLPLATIVSYVIQIADALQYAHENKLIHRDIKPENMLLGLHDTLLLSDFGLVLVAQSSESRSTKEIAGTVPYMAPEQIQGKPRAASDQYALGVVVYEWLSGTRPFEGSVFEIYGQHLHMTPPSFHEKGVAISSAVEDVVLKALAKDPRERFTSVAAFATALEHAFHLTQPSTFDHPLVGNAQLDQSALSTFVKTPPAQSALSIGVTIPPEAVEESTYLKMPLSQSSLPTVIPNPSPDYTLPTLIKIPLEEPHQSTNIVPSVDLASFSNVTMLPQILSPHTVLLDQSSQPSLPSTPQPQHAVPIADALPTKGNLGRQVSKPPRRGKRWWLAIAVVPLILLLTFGGIAYATPGMFFSFTRTLFHSPSTAAATARITITPASKDLKKLYSISAVTGTLNTSKHQVEARLLSSTTSPKSKTVNATGKNVITQGTQAQGLLWIFNVGSPVTLSAGTVIPNGPFENGKDYSPKIDMVLDETVTVPSGTISAQGQITVHAHVSEVGTIGNMAMLAGNTGFYHCFCVNGPTAYYYIDNVSYGGVDASFSGGQDPQSSIVVQQSDIDGAANALETAYNPDAQQVLQGQVHANERFVGTPTCDPNVTSNQNVGDAATTVTVWVSFTCTGEVYDQQNASAMAKQWLIQDAAQSLGAGYMLVGTIMTTQGQAKISDANQGTVLIPVTAEGIWVYQFSSAQEQAMAKQIVGKKKAESYTVLLRQPGVAHVNIQLSGGDGNTLPIDFQQIRFVILSVNGK